MDPGQSGPRSGAEVEAASSESTAAAVGEQGLTYAATLNFGSTPFRADKMARIFLPAAATVMDYGATGYAFHRADVDSEKFQFISYWNDKADFTQWWSDTPMQKTRQELNGITALPLYPNWHTVLEQG
jgi:quinol monooxygenase YgiN